MWDLLINVRSAYLAKFLRCNFTQCFHVQVAASTIPLWEMLKGTGGYFFLLSHMHVRIVIQEISTIVCYPTLHSEALYMRGELLLRAVSPTYIYLIQVEEARLCQQSNNCSVYALLSLLELLNSTWCFLEMWFFWTVQSWFWPVDQCSKHPSLTSKD